ncbi:25182_t:CDS:2, partial [Racocetra persica]
MLDIITFSLSELELSYRLHDFTIRYLKYTSFLLPNRYKDDFLDNCSSAAHLQHCIDLTYSKPTYSYNTNITIKLVFPTKNFATYDDNYSVLKELILPPYNSFNSLDSPKFFEFWCLQALVKFKWESLLGVAVDETNKEESFLYLRSEYTRKTFKGLYEPYLSKSICEIVGIEKDEISKNFDDINKNFDDINKNFEDINRNFKDKFDIIKKKFADIDKNLMDKFDA